MQIFRALVFLVCATGYGMGLDSDSDFLEKKGSDHWIIDINSIQSPQPEAISIGKHKKRLAFIQKVPSSESAPSSNGDTAELLRGSNNNIMRALAQTFQNVSSVANMSNDQWKRTIAFMVVSGTFSITQLALQAYLSSRSCS